MSNPRLFLTSMSTGGNVDNITEMVEPILPYLDGIIWVLHHCATDDPGAQYLESVKGAGKVIYRFWPGRHHVSMNDTLYTGLMEEGDLFLYCDALERPMLPFVSRIKSEIAFTMEEADLDVIAYFGKPFLMRYRETMEYRGSPHWGLYGWNNRGIEWSTIEPDESKVRLNTRPLKRPNVWGWVDHYLKYYVAYPAGSNHCLLGLEKNGDPNKLFPIREARRLEFRRYLKSKGVPLTVDGVRAWLLLGPDEEGKRFVREEKILNDAYRRYILNDTTLVDNHDFKDMVPIL